MSLLATAYAAEEGIAIHLAPTVLGYAFGIPLTNTLVTVWLVMVLLTFASIFIGRSLSLVPGGFQVVVEALVKYTHDYVEEVLGSKKYAARFSPLVLTIFIFILFINWVGLVPGVDAFGVVRELHGKETLVPLFHPANTDLNITVAFAIVAFVTIEITGVVVLGFFKYASKFINLQMLRRFTITNVLGFFIGIIELFSEVARLISFSFRLFGNIFAGKTLILVVMFFMPFVLPVPLLAFELFVGFIQAFIFAILTLFFIKLAIEEPH